jgi:hypothetical protein
MTRRNVIAVILTTFIYCVWVLAVVYGSVL